MLPSITSSFLSIKGHEACALLLLDRSASSTVNKQNKENKTPLHIAARNGLLPVVRELIRLGADCSLVDNEGQLTPGCEWMCVSCLCVVMVCWTEDGTSPLPPPSLGYTPALCCAPNPQVAECLFSILQAMDRQES